MLNKRGWTLVLGKADENLVGLAVDQGFPPGKASRRWQIRRLAFSIENPRL